MREQLGDPGGRHGEGDFFEDAGVRREDEAAVGGV